MLAGGLRGGVCVFGLYSLLDALAVTTVVCEHFSRVTHWEATRHFSQRSRTEQDSVTDCPFCASGDFQSLARAFGIFCSHRGVAIVSASLFWLPLAFLSLPYFLGRVSPWPGLQVRYCQALLLFTTSSRLRSHGLNDLSVGELYSAQPVFLLARKISTPFFSHSSPAVLLLMKLCVADCCV